CLAWIPAMRVHRHCATHPLTSRATRWLAAGVLLLAAAPLAWAQPASFAPMVKAQRGKVVHIHTRMETEFTDEPDANAPNRPPIPTQAMGTGIVVSADGLIVTNFHVVSNAPDITVTLESGRTYKADIVGTDAQTDLALIKIPATGLLPVEFGDSDRIEVGDWVIAMGSPLGLNYSVTAGIISAKGRNIYSVDNLAYGEFLQTDAAINPGSSGGPLFSTDGKVIGINSAVSRRGQGIAFAVPSNLVVEVVRQLRENGRVIRGWLGIVILDLTPELAQSLGAPENAAGVLVNDLQPEGPAAMAGLRKNDVITRLRGEKVQRVAQVQKLVALAKPGTAVAVEGLRRGLGETAWKPFSQTVQVGNDPNQNAATAETLVVERLGVELAAVPEVIRQRMGLAQGVGAQVERVLPSGVAEDVGLQAGDVILEVNRQEVRGMTDTAAVLNRTREPRVPILIRRGGQVLYLVLTLPR
ncbi:MAG TPA: trypsin-like peptidase domain-containing protein, partial [bacterium]